ncbi:MAG: MBL fold metallo-hydrolase [Oscillospiraceae bacterium]|nr:MBL fold metallo-hydrolase [Oscillospiraceae bacterium]
MLKSIFVSAHVSGNSQLILGEKSAVLVDCGLPFCVDETLSNLKNALGGRKLDAIILSHSHYDHIAALPFFREAYPDTPVYIHPYAAGVFTREGALKTMEMMCENAKRLFGKGFIGRKPELSKLKADVLLTDEQTIPFDDGVIRVMFTPGHTKDCVSLDWPQYKVTWLCETLGAPRPDGRVQPCFLTGYLSTVDCCKKIKSLGERRYIISHRPDIMTLEESREYLTMAEQVVIESAELVKRRFDAGDDFAAIFAAYKEVYWSEDYRDSWPFEAFKMNTEAAIATVLRELCGQ